MNSGLHSQTFSDPFPVLGELGSLNRMIAEHLAKIDGHKQRVEMIQNTRQEKTNELAEKKALQKSKLLEAKRLEFELGKSEENLARATAHSHDATGTHQAESVQKEVEFLSQQIAKLEENALNLLGESDALLSEMKDLETYLAGSEKALKEVQTEVEGLIKNDQKEIQNLKERFALKLNDLAPDYREAFLYVMKKFGKGKPLAWFENQHCDCCRFLIDRQSAVDLEHGIHPLYCPGCGRLLVIRRNS